MAIYIPTTKRFTSLWFTWFHVKEQLPRVISYAHGDLPKKKYKFTVLMLGPCPLCKKKLPSKDLETCCFFLRLRWTMMVWKLTTLSKSSRNCYYYIDKENKCHRLGTKHLSWCIYLESEVVDMCTNRSSFQNKTHKLETDSLSIGLSMLLGSILISQQQMGGPLSQVRPESDHEPTKMKVLKTQLNPFLRNTSWNLTVPLGIYAIWTCWKRYYRIICFGRDCDLTRCKAWSVPFCQGSPWRRTSIPGSRTSDSAVHQQMGFHLLTLMEYVAL